MPLDDRNKLNRVEELKSKLFSKNYQTRIEHRDVFSSSQNKDIVDSWEASKENIPHVEDKFFMRTSFFKKFFIFSIIIFVLAAGYAAYVYFIGGNTFSNNNIDISIVGNSFTAGGEGLPLVIGITNRNNTELDLADLVMQYSKGSSSDASADTQTLRVSIGTIPIGAVVNENLTPILFGEQGSVRAIKISLEYRVSGSNAIFVKDKIYNVTISSTPINLSVDAPTTVSPNQSITLNVKATLNATIPAPNILVRVDYPIGFQFVSASPTPAFGNNVWNIGDLAPGSEHGISISGKIVGAFNGDQKTFHVTTGSQSGADKSIIDVVFNSIQQIVSVQKPFIEANLFVNGVSQGAYATDSKTPIHAEIKYSNNLATQVNDLQIVAKISGNAFDRKTINVQQGFYNSANDTITWDKTSLSQLAQVNPGDSGSVAFSVSPLSLFSASGGIIASPSINIEIDIAGKQSVSGFASDSITNSSSAVINIISDVGFSDKALYYSGSFKNTGTIPPKVGKPTTYTVVWTLTNTANSISNVQVISTLPSWMSFVGPFLPATENLSYNSSTKQIIWNADRISKGAGVAGASKTVSFQISFTPSLSQVGSMPTILNSAVLTGHDDFANVDVRVSKAGLTTNLDSDSAFPANGGGVSN